MNKKCVTHFSNDCDSRNFNFLLSDDGKDGGDDGNVGNEKD